MSEIYGHSGRTHILVDGRIFRNAEDGLFEPESWGARDRWVGSSGEGRGAAHFVGGDDGSEYVLRHYRRGGLPGRVLEDCYLWTGLQRTRPWREWHLLQSLRAEGLPVPEPVAVRVVRRSGGLCYRGDILMGRVPGQPLSELTVRGGLSEAQWNAVGATLQRFHSRGVFHADLNAHNILLDGEAVYLIDFDRGALRRPGQWRWANLIRLRRSLDKLRGAFDAASLAANWDCLLTGYRGNSGSGHSALNLR